MNPALKNNVLRILIIDDEIASANMLRILIEKHIPEEKKVVCCNDPVKGLELVSSFKPSLVMLDIEMPGMNGFDFLNNSPFNNFDVIFTTAYDKYAIKAIRFSALDYLLKPIDIGELQTALNRHLIKQQNQNSDQQELIDNLLHNLQQKNNADFKLAVSVTEGIFLLDLKNIICLEGQNNYTKFYFDNQKPLLVARTIKEYEEILIDHRFIRVHKSFLVNKAHILKVDNDSQLWLHGHMQVPISRRRKAEIMRLFS